MKKYFTTTLVTALFSVALFSSPAIAQVPQILNYQGRVAVGTTNFNGTGQFRFALVDGVSKNSVQATATATISATAPKYVTGITVTNGGSGYTSPPAVTLTGGGGTGATATAFLSNGVVTSINPVNTGTGYTSPPTVAIAAPPATYNSTLWSNDGTSGGGGQPSAPVSLPVSKGLYSVLLGDTSLPNMTLVPATVFANTDVRLRVWFDDSTTGSQLLTPDQRISAVGYAMTATNAATAQTVADGAITGAKLASGAVANANLANPSLTITAGSGLGGGGAVSLGGSVSLNNAGVLSLAGGNGITVSGATGSITLGSSATSANTGSTLVARDGSGNFTAGTITAALSGNASTATTAGSATNFTGSLAGNVTGPQGATVVSTVGGLTAASVASGANLANGATDANTATAIVRRDAAGAFSAGGISATNVSGTTISTADNVYAVLGNINTLTSGIYSAGVRGVNNSTTGLGVGVYGSHAGAGIGIYGTSLSGNAIYGTTANGSSTAGVYGFSSYSSGNGVIGQSDGSGSFGVWGRSTAGQAVHADSISGYGVYASSSSGIAVRASGSTGTGVYGSTNVNSSTIAGVVGENLAASGTGIIGRCNATGGAGVAGIADGTNSTGVYGRGSTYGANFDGNVRVGGTLTKSAGSFKIDHPLDPANKYLSHSFVESPDMMNIYNGNVTTNADGDATITLPAWFEALNKDFRYQLTVIGQFAQVMVASKIQGNQFAIKTDKPAVEVSWQVTGIRHDAYASAHPIVVEETKTATEVGLYDHPELFGQPEEKGVSWVAHPRDKNAGKAKLPPTSNTKGN